MPITSGQQQQRHLCDKVPCFAIFLCFDLIPALPFFQYTYIMNRFATLAVLGAALSSASAFFYDSASGVFTLGALSLNGGNALAITSGTTTAFLTSAGIAAAGLGLLAAAVVKAAIIANAAGGELRR